FQGGGEIGHEPHLVAFFEKDFLCPDIPVLKKTVPSAQDVCIHHKKNFARTLRLVGHMGEGRRSVLFEESVGDQAFQRKINGGFRYAKKPTQLRRAWQVTGKIVAADEGSEQRQGASFGIEG